MAKNELVSLSLIYHEPAHAYAINSVIEHMGLKHWGKVSPASIYNALARLATEGSVRVTTEKVGNMPERKVYSITAKGKKRLKEEIKEAILSTGPSDHPFYFGTLFASGLPVDELIQVLKQRIKILEETGKELIQKYEHVKGHEAYHAMITIKAAQEHVKIETESTKELVKLVEKNPEYYNTYVKEMFQSMRDQID